MEFKHGDPGSTAVRIWTTRDGVGDLVQGFDLKSKKNVYRADRPMWSCLGFALEHMLPIERWVNDRQVAAKLRTAIPVALGVTKNFLRTLIPSTEKDEDESFSIPVSGAQPSNFMAMISMFTLKAAQRIFPPSSWPWTFLRQASLMVVQRNQYFVPELRRIAIKSKTGALGRLAFARGLKMLNHPASPVFASQGLELLDTPNFVHDLQVFYRGDSLVAKAMRTVFESIRGLPAEDVKALLALSPKGARTQMKRVLKILGTSSKRPIEEAIDEIVPVLLDSGLRAWTRQHLKRLAQ